MLEINEDCNENKNEPLIDDELSKINLTEKEILKCKENGFILIGKTGVGKTSLLNVIFKEEIGKVGHSSKSETKDSNYYCMKYKKENIKIYFCIIDTPGLYDSDGFDADINQKKDIKKLIAKEKIKIKGLLFLSNFQNERFDASEQTSLIEYNALFPMKDFWKRIIFIFTHYYGDPDGDSKEEIQERSHMCLTKIMKNIMEKVNKVSKPVDYKEINRKYINIYSKVKNNKQIKNNDSIRIQIIETILEYTKLNPMFSKLQIFHFEKYEIDLNDEYLYDCDLTIYLDSNDYVINKDFTILKRYPKNKDYSKNDQIIIYNSQKCEIDSDGNLINISNKKEGLNDIFQDSKSKIGGAITICSILGLICSGLFFYPTIPICLATLFGGVFMIKKSATDQEKIEKDKIMEIMENQKINEEIKTQISLKGSEILIDNDFNNNEKS